MRQSKTLMLHLLQRRILKWILKQSVMFHPHRYRHHRQVQTIRSPIPQWFLRCRLLNNNFLNKQQPIPNTSIITHNLPPILLSLISNHRMACQTLLLQTERVLYCISRNTCIHLPTDRISTNNNHHNHLHGILIPVTTLLATTVHNPMVLPHRRHRSMNRVSTS